MRYPLPWLETITVCGHHQTFIKYNPQKFVQAVWSKRKTIKYLGTLNIKIEKKAFADCVYLLLIFFQTVLIDKYVRISLAVNLACRHFLLQ